MTSAPTTPLRQRMIEDMTIRQLGSKTQHDYVHVVADFARFFGRSPDQTEPEDLRRYQLHLAAEGASPSKMNAAVPDLDRLRTLITAQIDSTMPPVAPESEPDATPVQACPGCGGRMRIIEVFLRGRLPQTLVGRLWIDSS